MTKYSKNKTLPYAFVAGSPLSNWGAEQRVAASCDKYWRWGNDNLFPTALAQLARQSPTHRRIINDKADYISGKGFNYDASIQPLDLLVNRVNGSGESLRQLLNKLAFDKCLFGNAFVEVVTDSEHSFLALYHHDASQCRVGRDSDRIWIHGDWRNFRASQAVSLPLYPHVEECADGSLRAMIHYKDYEPMFRHYGVPPYIAGMNVAAIAYKTDRWNVSRLDNSFQMSGVMVLGAQLDNEEQAEQLIRTAESKFAGRPGQVMFLVKNDSDAGNSQFIPLNAQSEGDWRDLHDQATGDVVAAHSWFRSLSGLDYSAGFSSERIIQEYEVALNTVISGEQEELLEPIRGVIRDVLACDESSLTVINRPPAKVRPRYMRVWEARRADGLAFDAEDPQQNLFLAQLPQIANV